MFVSISSLADSSFSRWKLIKKPIGSSKHWLWARLFSPRHFHPVSRGNSTGINPLRLSQAWSAPRVWTKALVMAIVEVSLAVEKCWLRYVMRCGPTTRLSRFMSLSTSLGQLVGGLLSILFIVLNLVSARNRSINQSTNQPINQSTNQPITSPSARVRMQYPNSRKCQKYQSQQQRVPRVGLTLLSVHHSYKSATVYCSKPAWGPSGQPLWRPC